MNYLVHTTVLALLMLSVIKESFSERFCKQTVSTLTQTRRSVTKYHEQVYTTSCGWWGRRCRRTRYIPYEVYYYITKTIMVERDTCCNGYENFPICSPKCSPGCYNGGICVKPETCNCISGWEGKDCQKPICSQGCHNGGTCTLPGICSCSTGWTGSSCTTPICSRGCYNGGTCILPESCNCKLGWTGNDCRTPICSQGCHNGGTCRGPGICSCNSGWTGSNCKTPYCSQGCHNGGICTSPYTCTCRTGWIGADCKTAQCSQSCLNGGICIKPNICGCKTGWTGYNCTMPHCPQGCYNGKCDSPKICSCNVGWTGLNCTKDINECIDPRTCGFNQKCTNTAGSYKCECFTGYKPDSRGLTTIDTYYHCTDINECEDNHGCSQICNNHIGSFNCECMDGYLLQADEKQCLDINECIDDNAGCDHSCVNTGGSYYCKCNRGYQLQADMHNCTDIMECQDGLHNCSQVCVELQGQFSCTCYDGYELLEDGVSCKEIDLCETGISGCQQLCIKTNGSFYCDCLTGYQLLSDNMTCKDINECDQENGGCSHICTNTFGSFKCACEEGYTLDFDGFNCTALPCLNLMDPRNGQYYCDGLQVTGAACRLKCNRGYKVVGAKKRVCLSTSKWSENNSFCEILHCDELSSPENGNVVLPCATELGTMCRIVCSPGFYTNSTKLTQECELANETTTEWSEPPNCVEKQLCYPNPCKHNGTCMKIDETAFACNCDGVGYTGETCDILLINAPEFSTLTVNSPIKFSMSSSPDREFTLELISDDRKSLKVIPSSMTFSQTLTHYNITVKAKKPGKYTLIYKVSDQTLRYQPILPAIILVTNGTVEKSNYFDKYGVKLGILKPGCCSSENLFNIQCPSSKDSPLFLKSTCGWTEKGTFHSPGIIFSSDNSFDMPIAIAGAKIRQRKSDIDLLSLSKEEFENDCIACNDGNCGVIPVSLNDVQSFLYHESLASTYFYYSSKLIPKWLKLNTIPSNRTHDIHSYTVDLVSSDYLKTIAECLKFTIVSDGLYSVMLYSGSLRAKVAKELVQFQSNGSSVFCFAVNLCKGSSSPLYIAIPDKSQDVLQSVEFVRDLKIKGWTITVNSLVMSDSQISTSETVKPILYWNGKDFFTSHRQQPNIITSVDFNKHFSSNDTMQASWNFTGDVFWFHDNINKAYNPEIKLTWNVYFNGITRLSITIPVYGEVSSLQFTNDTELSLLLAEGFNNNETCHDCSDPSGFALKLVYHIAGASTGLFSTLLAIPQNGINPQLSCPLDSFMFLNRNHDLEAVSIISTCLGINLGLFPIKGLETHIYIFNKCKIDSLCTTLNYTDANIVVWSTFPGSLSKLSLGHFLELLPVSHSNRTGLVATFSKYHNHFKAVLPSIKVSLFDTTFKSEAIINEQQLTFSKSVKLFNKYRVKLNGRINQMINWENAAIEVKGVFLNNPDNIPRLLCYQIATYIDILYNRSLIEVNNAEAVYDRAVLRFMKVNMTYNEYEIIKNQSNDQVKLMEDEYQNVNNTLHLITKELEKAGDNVKSLQKNIDDLCTIKQCPEVCIPQQICEECKRSITVPIQGTCLFQCMKTENITIITGSEKITKYEYTPQEDCSTYPSCQVFTCRSTKNCVTNYVSKPVDFIRYKTETRAVNTVAICEKPCSETVVTAPLTALCCANFTCNSTEQDVECLNQNQQCTQTREIVYSNLEEAKKNATKILQSLDEAKRNETVIKLRLQRSKVNYNFAEKKFNESKRSYTDAASVLEIVTTSFEAVKNKLQLAKLERVKNLTACGFAPPSFFEIQSVSFDTTIVTESPKVLAMDIVIFLPSQNISVTETLYIDFNNLDASIKQVAVTIVEKLLLSQSLSKRHSRNALNGSVLSENELYFQRKCIDVKNILEYIKEINASIFAIAATTISSVFSLKDNVLELSKLINYSSSISKEELTIDSQKISDIINRNLTHFNSTNTKKSEEINEVIKLMQEYSLSSQELESELGNTVYQSWQAKMEELHNQTGSAAGFPCSGFSSCLQKVVDTLNDLLVDIPVNDILSDFSIAAQNFMDLALLQNYSILSTVTNTHVIYNIASDPVITDYWCASAPRIIAHPTKYINLTENAILKLSCIAEIEEFTSYQWKKDGIQLLDQKNSTLVVTNVTLSDNGNYTCVVTNQVGSTTSFNATVEILQYPSFFLEPDNTNVFFGNLNGASFRCNASGSPYPGYKWYFQPKGMKGFNEIPNSNQNILVIVPPLPKDEGSYYCEAFIGNVSTRSRVANLTVLHSTVVQIAQTVYFNFSFLNKFGKTEMESSAVGSGNELTIESNYVTNDFSGSGNNEIGSGINRNITITPYTKLALEKNLLNVLNTLMSFESTTVENISLHFVTPFNSAVSFTLYSHNITYTEASFSKINQLVPQAMMEWADIWQKLQELLSISGFIITDDEYEYESIPSSLTVDMLQLICPAGKEVSATNNLICSNCPPGSYQILDVRRVVDENDGRVTQYMAPECVSCPIGYYQDEQGHATCKQCPSALTSGTIECPAQCSPGEYSQTGIEPCLACPNETHSFINGSTTCFNCSDEKYLLLCPIHKIRYCPQGCYNNGTCISPYTCVCTAGWTGIDCNTASTIKFSQLTYSAAEDNGPLQPVLILSNALSANFTVQVVNINETAIGGIDYHSGPYNVTFPAGVTSVLFNIPIFDDDTPEENENFSIAVNTDSLPDGVTTGSPSRVIMMIRNDDRYCPQGCYNNGTCVSPYNCVCTAGWTGIDCNTGYCPQGCYNNGTCVSPYTCVCTAGWTGIDCNTASTVKFSQLTYSAAEDNGPLQPVLILSNSLSANITIQVVDVNETAFGGNDYYSGPYNVKFPAGVTSILFNITIYDDDMPEDNKNFSIVIDTDSLPDGVTTGSPSRVIMIIRNDDTECAIPKLDVVFVLDVSISIKNEQNFGVMKDFVKNTADLVNINLNNSLAAVVLFGGNAWIRFSLTEYTGKDNFQKAVDDIKYEDIKQIGTNTPDALNLLRIAGQDGRLGLRNDTIKIVVLLTDGRPNLNHLNISRSQVTADTQEAATKLHDSGIYDQVYSVGIEGNKPIGKILNQIANPPSLVFPLTGFDAALFQQLTQNFTSSFCDDGSY